MGQLWGIKVHAANIHDSKAGVDVIDAVLKKIYFEAICGDQAYNGTTTLHVINDLHLDMLISPKIKGKQPSSKRWIVERTFSWLNNFRRLSKDYERLVDRAENICLVGMIRLGVNHLLNT